MTYTPYFTHGVDRASRWLVICDHATNTVPGFIAGGDLGISHADMSRHIAFDIGAAGVARALADALNAPAILSNFSRLVIDPNRGEDDPTLLMKLYDGTIIPANRHADAAEIQHRLEKMHRPYHQAVADLATRRDDTVILSVHSFTKQLKGRAPRPWHIGVLYADDTRLSGPVMDHLNKEPDLCIGDNEPYKGDLPGDTIDRHALAKGRLNVLIELRNDLIEDEDQQIQWGNRLAPLLQNALADTGLQSGDLT